MTQAASIYVGSESECWAVSGVRSQFPHLAVAPAHSVSTRADSQWKELTDLSQNTALRESKAGRCHSEDKEDGEPKTKHLREEEEEGEKHRELRLRNYVPEDEDLKKRRVPQAKPVAVEEKVKEQLEAAKPEPVIEEVVSAWATLASSLLLCVLFLFATCSSSAPHSFLSLLYSLPTCLFALIPLLPPSPSPISLLLEPSLPLVLGRPLHPDVCLLLSQDLANLAPRKPDW
ncbi:coiled-coil domain-containing protein 12 isoform X8 [Pongo pygmaeus]|uniref:coiled-coil domain-containing protein 12 isoform X8 n=1 Tax=Pongo pygmaeus TaxID=9600 RepID=UPI00300D2491